MIWVLGGDHSEPRSRYEADFNYGFYAIASDAKSPEIYLGGCGVVRKSGNISSFIRADRTLGASLRLMSGQQCGVRFRFGGTLRCQPSVLVPTG